jgi:uncharacterized repeat protein (TIGR02543 family)
MRRILFLLFMVFVTLGLMSCTGDAKITISFNSNGGNEIETIEVNTNQTSLNLPEPVRSGYTFEGWFLDEALTQPFTIGALLTNQTLTLYAKWSQILVTYTMTFESNGGSAVSAITLAAGASVSAPTAPTRVGYTFGGWYSDVGLTSAYTFSTMPAENITIYAKWNVVVVQSTMSFESNGGSVVASITQNVGSTVVAPTQPTRTGYTFGGWYSDIGLTTTYSFTTMPAQNITLYAKWTVNQYTITFNSNGGSAVTAITQNFGTTVTAPTAPTREGYTFDGWFSNAELTSAYTFTTMPAQNITLYAKWAVNQYTITFNSNGGSAVTAITQNFGTVVLAPTAPTREGYTFDGWFSNTELTTAYAFTTISAQNITLYAKWIVNQYTITFNSNGGSAVTAITQNFGSAVTAPTAPTREGYTFDGWFSNTELTTAYAFTTISAQNITLYAKWTVNQYTITFNSNGGSAVAVITQNFGSAVTAPTAPTREGYTFDGWFSNAELTTAYAFTTMPALNITLYAKWTVNQYTITFNSNGGSAVTAITQNFGSAVTAPTAPTREGYTFDGWFSNTELTTAYAFTTMPAQNITLYAKWMQTLCTITLIDEHGNIIGTDEVECGETFIATPIESEGSIGTIHLSSDFDVYITTDLVINGDITLYIKWWTLLEYYTMIDLNYIKQYTASIINYALQFNSYLEDNEIRVTLSYFLDLIMEAQTVQQILNYLNQMSNQLNILVLSEPSSDEMIEAMRETMKNVLSSVYSDFVNVSLIFGGYPIGPEYLTNIFEYLDAQTEKTTAIPKMTKEIINSMYYMFEVLGIATKEYVRERIDDIYSIYVLSVEENYIDDLHTRYIESITTLQSLLVHGNILEVEIRFINYVESLPKDELLAYALYVIIAIRRETDLLMLHPYYEQILILADSYIDQIADAHSIEEIDNLYSSFELQLQNVSTPVQYHVIYFESNGGTEVAPISGFIGEIIPQPTDPEKQNFVFSGWYLDPDFNIVFEFGNLINQDIVLYAKWEPVIISSTVSQLYSEYMYGVVYELEVVVLFLLDVGYVVADETGAILISSKYEYDSGNLIRIRGTVIDLGDMELLVVGSKTTDSIILEMNVQCPLMHTPITVDEILELNFGDSSNWLKDYEVTGQLTFHSYDQNEKLYAIDDLIVIFKEDDLLKIMNLMERVITAKIILIPRFFDDGITLFGVLYMIDSHVTYESILYTISFQYPEGNELFSIGFYNIGDVEIPELDVEGYAFMGWYLDQQFTQMLEHISYENLIVYPKLVIKQYYVEFHTNGGEWIDGLYADYGTTYEPVVAIKEGYTFEGWYEDYELTLYYGESLTSIPGRNLDLYAKWTINTYTITFVTNGGGSLEPVTGEYESQIDYQEPSREGYTFDGWYEDEELSLYYAHWISYMPSRDITLYAKWNINQYYVEFHTNGGEWIDGLYADYGTTYEPVVAIKEGYTFEGWYEDYELTLYYGESLTSIPGRNLDLYAKWTINTYTITFVTNGGGSLEPVTGEYESQIDYQEPSREGYTFDGWYEDEELSLYYAHWISYMPSRDITLYAKWNINQYYVEFHTNGGEWIDGLYADYGTTYEPVVAIKEGYTFEGWYEDYELTLYYGESLTSIPGRNLDLYAKWTINTYTITFVTNGGGSLEPVTGEYESQIDYQEPSREGYTFDGWYEDEELSLYYAHWISYMPSRDITLYAKWNINQYYVEFHTNGGEWIDGLYADYGTTYEPVVAIKEGYTFEGWYEDYELTLYYGESLTSIPGRNLDLYAKWTINTYTITFVTNGGGSLEPVTGEYESQIDYQEPSREGYTFDGWYEDEELSLYYAHWISYMPSRDITLYAKWIEN